jgi:hypothetical protein
VKAYVKVAAGRTRLAGTPVKDEMAWFEQPYHNITAERGSLEEAVQRVLYNQPRDRYLYKDRELILLEDFLKHGVSSNYVLVRGLAARCAPPPPLSR